jgi:hypothetical protein
MGADRTSLQQRQGLSTDSDSECRGRVSPAYRLDVRPRTAPVSHQKRPCQNATNAIELERKRSKINKAHHYPVAHNGLVAGSSPAGPTKRINGLSSFLSQAVGPLHQKRFTALRIPKLQQPDNYCFISNLTMVSTAQS